LVHRDVKPGNVLIQGRGPTEHAYLTDFGLTKSTSSESGLTQSGKWVGTLDYAAPEQLRGDPLDARTDIYALGCLLYQLLTGRVPYPLGSAGAKVWAHVSDPPPVPSTTAPDLPKEIDEVIARAMAKDPTRRYHSAGDLGRAARAAARGELPPSDEGGVATGAAAPQPEALAHQDASTKGATVTDRGAPPVLDLELPAPLRRDLRRIVTIALCQATPSTDMAAEIDPDSLRTIMARAREVMRSALEHHGGTVHSYVGDAVMAVFGIPTVHEDDALRAVRAVDELREALGRLNQELRDEWSVRLEVRAGLSTGEVVTGDPSRGQPLLAGDAVNIATRLEQAAAIGEVLIGRDTYQLVRGAAKAESVEPLTIPGKQEPVPALTLGEVERGASRVPRRLDSPMVAREAELRLLNEAFERTLDERGCQLATVLGPAGAGKSRLTREFLQGLGGQARTLVGRCLSYGEGITFWPVGEVVRDAAQISEEDSPYEKRSKIAALLPEDEDAGHIVACVAGALGISEAGSPPEEISWAIRKLLEALAAEAPLVVVFDDVQWGEATFLDLVEHIVGFSRGYPILVICMARPELSESRPSLASAGTRLPLEPLDVAASATLIENLLGEARLDPEVFQRITEAAEGNPLFLEEMVQMLIDDGLLERENGSWRAAGDLSTVTVPPTIQALISARLDRLDHEEREVLERGAVIGHEFWRGAVRDLLPEGSRSELGYRLDTCVRKKLVRPGGRGFAGEESFHFAHILIRDVAYQALLKQARAELHERFAAWLEERAGEHVSEYEEIIGYHLEQAYRCREALGPVDERSRRLAARAAERLTAAGRRAFARSDLPATVNLYQRATALLPESDPARLELLPDLSYALRETGSLSRADEVVGEAIEAARRAGDEQLQLHAAIERAFGQLYTDSDVTTDDVVKLAERAIRVYEEAGDDELLARAWHLLGDAHSTACRNAASAQAFERGLTHARRSGDRREEAQLLTWIAFSHYWGPTPVGEAIRHHEQILEQAKGERVVTASIYLHLAGLTAMEGRFEEAREIYARARAIMEELGFRHTVGAMSLFLGQVELLARNPSAAERELRSGYETLTEMNEKAVLSTVAALLAEALYEQGRREESERFTRESEEAAARDDLLSQIGWRATRAKLLALDARVGEARALAREAVALSRRTDDLNLRGKAAMDLAEVLELSGSSAEVAPIIEEALEFYDRKGNRVAADEARRRLRELA